MTRTLWLVLRWLKLPRGWRIKVADIVMAKVYGPYAIALLLSHPSPVLGSEGLQLWLGLIFADRHCSKLLKIIVGILDLLLIGMQHSRRKGRSICKCEFLVSGFEDVGCK